MRSPAVDTSASMASSGNRTSSSRSDARGGDRRDVIEIPEHVRELLLARGLAKGVLQGDVCLRGGEAAKYRFDSRSGSSSW